jgi:hypothetical protein
LYDSLAADRAHPYVPGMTSIKKGPAIREEDVEARTIQRRTFLGRFGAVAGLVGLVGFTTGCGNESDSADSDFGDSADVDPTDAVDSDTGDPADSD